MKSGRFIELTVYHQKAKKLNVFIDDIIAVCDWEDSVHKGHLFLTGPHEISVEEDRETIMKKIKDETERYA